MICIKTKINSQKRLWRTALHPFTPYTVCGGEKYPLPLNQEENLNFDGKHSLPMFCVSLRHGVCRWEAGTDSMERRDKTEPAPYRCAQLFHFVSNNSSLVQHLKTALHYQRGSLSCFLFYSVKKRKKQLYALFKHHTVVTGTGIKKLS